MLPWHPAYALATWHMHEYQRHLAESCTAVPYMQGSIERVPEDIVALRPAILVGVPRVWERVVASAQERIRRRGPVSRTLFGWAYRSVCGLWPHAATRAQVL